MACFISGNDSLTCHMESRTNFKVHMQQI